MSSTGFNVYSYQWVASCWYNLSQRVTDRSNNMVISASPIHASSNMPLILA